MTQPEVRNLKGLLNYQAGSIVSRVLAKNKSGNVTLFAFDNGEGLSEHTTPHDALVVVVEGNATITISGEPHQVSEGDTILMPANHPHAILTEQPFKMLLVMLKSSAE